MRKTNRIEEIRKRYQSDDGGQVIDLSAEIQNADPERVPQHVWAVLQAAGEEAAAKLLALLRSPSFDRLSVRDQARLMTLAMDRAYGKADGGLKRSVKVHLSADGQDAVTASLERLSGAATLPEHRARDVTPETTEKPQTGATPSK